MRKKIDTNRIEAERETDQKSNGAPQIKNSNDDGGSEGDTYAD